MSKNKVTHCHGCHKQLTAEAATIAEVMQSGGYEVHELPSCTRACDHNTFTVWFPRDAELIPDVPSKLAKDYDVKITAWWSDMYKAYLIKCEGKHEE